MKDKVKVRARLEVKLAIKKGLIKRRPCERCGHSPSHAHHRDYSKPLQINWLCPKHHSELHTKLRQQQPTNMYSIAPVLHNYKDKNGLQKVAIQIIHNRMKVYETTNVKVLEENWKAGQVIKHPMKESYNRSILVIKHTIETRLLNAFTQKRKLNKEELSALVKNADIIERCVEDFIYDLEDAAKKRKGPNDGVVRHIHSLANKIREYDPGLRFSDISLGWLQSFEGKLYQRINRYGERLDGNTVHANMKRLKGILRVASKNGLILKEQFEDYKIPPYHQKEPSYLVEDEINRVYDLLQVVHKPTLKLSGYYFLLSVYAGYRISDLKRFNYEQQVQSGRITLRAKKNKRIVSILIHSKLQQVLDYIHDKPLTISEQKMREHIKELVLLAGINKDITPHSGRHSFGMLLAEKGFDLEEIAELLGDSIDIARVYVRISNTRMDKKIMEKLG